MRGRERRQCGGRSGPPGDGRGTAGGASAGGWSAGVRNFAPGCIALVLLAAAGAARCQVAESWEYGAYECLTIRSIEVSGNRHTKDYVILRELQAEVGEPLTEETVRTDLKRLTKLSALAKVDIAPQPAEDGVVYVVTVSETAWLLPTAIPNHSEENGWSLGPMLLTPNGLGRGISLSLSTQFGGITKYSVLAVDPWLWCAPRQLSISGGTTYQERKDKIRDSNEITSTSSLRAVLYPGRNRFVSIGLGAQYLRAMSDKPGVTLSPRNHDHLRRVELLCRVNTVEDPLNPRAGWVAGLQEMKTGGRLGGDGDSWRSQADVARYQPLSERGVLAVGGVFDHQTGVVGEEIPTYLQYSLGGVNNLRGYSRTRLGKVFLGKNQLLGTVEYNFLMMSPRKIQLFGVPFLSARVGFNAVIFVDYGVAWSEEADLAWSRSRTGYGLGVHAMVPGVDRIRLDVGFSQEGDVEIHIGTRSKLDAHR